MPHALTTAVTFPRLVLLSAIVFAACRHSALVDAEDQLVARPEQVDFGPVVVGSVAVVSVDFEGSGSLRLDLAPPFGIDEPAVFPPATRALTFTPDSVGRFEQHISLPGGAGLRLSGEGVARQACVSDNPCVLRSSSLEGRCVDTNVVDGSPCEQPCVMGGRCEAGQCVGAVRSCDDANPCTVDACDPSRGCFHDAETCAAPTAPCLAQRCDPVRGCVAEPVEDGVSCGAHDCVSAQICLAGACVVRPVPDGAACGEPSACQDPGVCVAGQCSVPPPRKLRPAWKRSSSLDGLRFPGLADAAGNLYWLEDYRRLVSVTPAGTLRYAVPISVSVNQVPPPNDTMLLAGDLIILSYHQDHFVEARRQRDGALVWRRDLSPGDAGTHAGWPMNITDLASSGSQLYVVGFFTPLAGQSPGVTVLTCLELATGTTRWERTTGETSPPPSGAAFLPSSLSVDSLGPIVGSAYGEHQQSGPNAFQMVAFTSNGDRRWSRGVIDGVFATIDDRTFFRSAFSLGWVDHSGGAHQIPTFIPAAIDRPAAFATDAGVLIVGFDGARNVIVQAEHQRWVPFGFTPRQSIGSSPPTSPPVLTAAGRISFVFNGQAGGNVQPVLVELDPRTNTFSSCQFDIDPWSMVSVVTPAVELPGLLVVSDWGKSKVWAFHR